jgi:predicted ATP-dependent endonuclease of OLD family
MKIKIESNGAEVEITDLMVFIGPDGTLNMQICEAICSWLHKQNRRYMSSTIVSKYPEIGLFPIAQSDLVAYYANLFNSLPKCCLLMTTHSPYILTALNNYICAYQVGQKNPTEVSALIPKHLWIDPKRVSAYFVENGTVRSIMDEELQQIKAEEIDQASTLTNEMYDRLLEINNDNE